MIIKKENYIDTWYSPKRFMRETITHCDGIKDKYWYIITKPSIKYKNFESYFDGSSIKEHRKTGPASIKKDSMQWKHKDCPHRFDGYDLYVLRDGKFVPDISLSEDEDWAFSILIKCNKSRSIFYTEEKYWNV